MVVQSLADLPDEYGCNLCGGTKPVAEMVVRRRKDLGAFHLAPRCKDCHNGRERGHRREYKRSYLQRWRKKNPELTRSYWKERPDQQEQSRASASRYYERHRDALCIKGRLKTHGVKVTLSEAYELLEKFGVAYPTGFGLTPEGRTECERIRSRMRSRGGMVLTSFEIRLMVYEDGFFITPERQKRPYKKKSAVIRARRRLEVERARAASAGVAA
jgi:hypothetical protein